MVLIVGIDPSINHCAVAILGGDEKLVHAALARPNIRQMVDDGEDVLCRATLMAMQVFAEVRVFATMGSVAADFRDITVVVEWPQMYLPGRSKPAASIMPMAAVGGAVAALLRAEGATVRAVAPSTWKGQMSDEATQARVLSRLGEDTAERRLYESALKNVPKSLQHNVKDAVGIALYAAGRFHPKLGI